MEKYLATNSEIKSSVVSFSVGDIIPILEFKTNGDILVKGKIVENDTEIVEAFREFLIKNNYSRE